MVVKEKRNDVEGGVCRISRGVGGGMAKEYGCCRKKKNAVLIIRWEDNAKHNSNGRSEK